MGRRRRSQTGGQWLFVAFKVSLPCGALCQVQVIAKAPRSHHRGPRVQCDLEARIGRHEYASDDYLCNYDEKVVLGIIGNRVGTVYFLSFSGQFGRAAADFD